MMHSEQESDLIALVNPLQGTDSDIDLSRGNCLPLICRPFSMTGWSPQTDEGPWLFSYRARKLQGIRATHQPSAWIGDYGHFTLMPQTGPLILDAKARASVVRPTDFEVTPDAVRALFWRYQTLMELTPTERCAVLRLTFPRAEAARLLVHTFAGPASFEVHPEQLMLTGLTRATSGGTPENFACYFAAVFDQPFSDVALIEEDGRLAASVEFDTASTPVVVARIATSFISVEQALTNLRREVGTRSFEEVRAETRSVWNEQLGRVAIEGADERRRRTFYSCLYRTLLFPRIWYEYDQSEQPVHYSPYDGAVHPGVMYADNGFWDTYRTVYPLLALLDPVRTGDIIRGWLNAAAEGGWLPAWSSPGYRGCMIGTHCDAVIADAYARGVRDFDLEAAYNAARRDAMEPGDPAGRFGRQGLAEYASLGYVPADRFDSAAARTLDYAYDDFCVAQLARALGRDDDYRLLVGRALNYRNVYDPAAGLMRARLSDGSWLEPFDEFAWDNRAYIEGSAWQHSWAVPHDPAGLAALMGGPEALAARLDRMLSLPPIFRAAGYSREVHEMTEMALATFGQYAHSNQPVHHALYLYAAVGQPWQTQRWVRNVLDELYSPEPDGLPGDEDNGEMSAWYILSALGIYPLCPGHPSFVFGSPLFERATLRLPGGDLVIEGRGAGDHAVYVRELQVNDRPYSKLWIAHDTLAAGATLTFVLGHEPVAARSYAAEDLPFSLSAGGA